MDGIRDNIIVLREISPRYGYGVIGSLVSEGRNVICLSRLHPDYITKRFDLGDARCLWLSGRRGANVLSPKSLDHILSTTMSEVGSMDSPLVFVDGIEYLLLWNDMTRVLTMLDQLGEAIESAGGQVLVCIDPETFERRDLVMISDRYPQLDASSATSITGFQKIARIVRECENQRIEGLKV